MIAKRWAIGLLSLGVLALVMAIVLPMTVFAARSPGGSITIDAIDSNDTGDTLKAQVTVAAADVGGGGPGDGVAATGTVTYRDKSARTTTTVAIDCVATESSTIRLLSDNCSGQTHVRIDLSVSPVEIRQVREN